MSAITFTTEPLGALRALLRLKENWDDEGAKPIEPRAVERAHDFLRCATWGAIPAFCPVADGSVDLWWRTDKFELLVNLPAEGDGSFYGDNLGGAVIKGTGANANAARMATWMRRFT